MGRILLIQMSLVLVLAACVSNEAGPATTIGHVSETTTTSAVPEATTPLEDAVTTTVPTATTTTVPGVVVLEVTVIDGEVAEVEATLDDDVRLVISAGVAEEVHLHTYDLHAAVSAGAPAVLEFVASIPGVFEIEFEQSGALVAELTVAP